MRAKSYWEERLSTDFSLGGVGDRRLGVAYNKWLYRARRRALGRALRLLRVDVAGKRALDLGCGTGFYVDYWLEKGASSVTGVDLTEVSINNLKQRYPGLEFVCADIASEAVAALGKFEIVDAFDVLFHIVDEETFVRAWANIAACLAEDGFAFVTDAMTREDMPLSRQECHRSYDRYRSVAESAGLEVVHLAPIFYTMLNSVDSRDASGPLRVLWWLTPRLLKASRRFRLNTVLGHLIGVSLYTLDGVVQRLFRTGPTLKLMVLRPVRT